MSRFLSGIPKLEQVPSVNRQSGGDEDPKTIPKLVQVPSVNRQSVGDEDPKTIPKLEQVPSVNRQSGGDEAKRIGLVGRLHLSICGRVGGRGRICIKHLYCWPSQPFCCGACSADLPVIASLGLFLKERHTKLKDRDG